MNTFWYLSIGIRHLSGRVLKRYWRFHTVISEFIAFSVKNLGNSVASYKLVSIVIAVMVSMSTRNTSLDVSVDEVFDEMPMNKFLGRKCIAGEYYGALNSSFSNKGLDEWYLVDLFIFGLQPELGNIVRLFKPKSISIAYCLALLDEVSEMNVDNELVDNVTVETVEESFTVENRLVDNVRCDEAELEVSKMDENSYSKEVEKESIESVGYEECFKENVNVKGSGVGEIDDDNQCLDDENTIVGSATGYNEEQEVGIEADLKLNLLDNSKKCLAVCGIVDTEDGEIKENTKIDEQKESFVRGNKMFPNEVCRQTGVYTIRRWHDMWNEQGWEDEDKDLNVFVNESDVYDIDTKVLIYGNKFIANKKLGDLEMVKPGMEVQRELSDVDATNNEGSFRQLKFDIWEWPKMGRKREKCKRWPNRKKKWEEACYGVYLLSPACSEYLQPGINRLPTRHNLDLRGIDLDSTLCPVCNEAVETDQHLFLDCDIAQHLWKLIIKWWGLNDYPKDILGIVRGLIRNRRVFDLKPPRKDTLEAEIKTLSFSWIT
nr:RNA-directed DNA polymerase, eukaryota, reverse transcriptase zinc-binding domain protein [Tanacetum cinerariifolium]